MSEITEISESTEIKTKVPFWRSLPKILSASATLIAAVTGLVIAITQNSDPVTAAPITAVHTADLSLMEKADSGLIDGGLSKNDPWPYCFKHDPLSAHVHCFATETECDHIREDICAGEVIIFHGDGEVTAVSHCDMRENPYNFHSCP